MLATVSEYAASPDASVAPFLVSSAAEAPFLVSSSDLAPCSGFASPTLPGFDPCCGESLSGPSVRAAIYPTPAAKASMAPAAAAKASILRETGSCCNLCIMTGRMALLQSSRVGTGLHYVGLEVPVSY